MVHHCTFEARVNCMKAGVSGDPHRPRAGSSKCVSLQCQFPPMMAVRRQVAGVCASLQNRTLPLFVYEGCGLGPGHGYQGQFEIGVLRLAVNQ